jgi:hypothetical protein
VLRQANAARGRWSRTVQFQPFMRSSVKIEHRCEIERVAIWANDGLGIRGI